MSLRSALPIACAIALAASPSLAGTHAVDLSAAQAKAIETGKPILVKIGTEWCAACNAFDKAVAENVAFETSISENAVLCRIDAEKGKGVEIAGSYSVHGYPTFVLTNAEGEVLDRWMGFGETAEFTETLVAAVENPMTVLERVAAFAKEPSESDALKIGDLRHAERLYAEALAYYRRAADLATDSDHSARVFRALAGGAKKNVFTADEVRDQADVVYASDHASLEDLMQVLYSMRSVAKYTGDPSYFTPYLELAYARTEGADGWVAKVRNKMAADYALHVQKDADGAVELKKAAMAEGWMEDSAMLNDFAWWCFENEVNLEEAEQLARRGVELAESAVQKALVLDTLAELCNANGNCGESLELIRLAIAEDPTNDYYTRQEERFAELFAQQSR